MRVSEVLEQVSLAILAVMPVESGCDLDGDEFCATHLAEAREYARVAVRRYEELMVYGEED